MKWSLNTESQKRKNPKQCDIHVVGKAFNAFSKISENVIYRSEKYTVNSINMWHEYANITNQKSKEFLSRIPFKDLTNSI